MEKDGNFWIVWSRGGHNPNCTYETRESADAEARRLASTNPGITFIVLKSVGGFRAAIMEPVRMSPDECLEYAE